MSRPIRTLLFSTLFPSSVRPVHGIFVETRLRELLRSGEVETKVVAPVPWFPFHGTRWGEYAKYANTPARDVRNGIDVLHPRYGLIPKFGMTSAPALLAAGSVNAIRGLIDQGYDFDVIDAHYYYPDGVAAALLARHFNKPLVITARGTDLNLIPEHALPRRMIRWAASRANASIGVCRALVDVLRDWGIDDGRLHVFRNGVDLQRFRPEPPDTARQRLGIHAGPVLLSVGHLIERKGHHLVVEAMPTVLREFPEARLYIVGEGEERVALQALVERLGLAGRVQLTGAIANDELCFWYSAADVLALASSREGWANVLLESMACGTPVAATRIWGTPEVVETEDVGVLIADRSAVALSDGLRAVLRNPRDRLVVRTYAERFSWDATTRAQIDLFTRLRASNASFGSVA